MPTTSKGLQYPASADNVNIASDIQTLATNIDTVWSAQTYGLTTKGQLLTRTASALTTIPVGTDGQVLSALSSDAEGIVWGQEPRGNVTAFASVTTSTSPEIITFTDIPQTHTDLLLVMRVFSTSSRLMRDTAGMSIYGININQTNSGFGFKIDRSSQYTVGDITVDGSASAPTTISVLYRRYAITTVLNRQVQIESSTSDFAHRAFIFGERDPGPMTTLSIDVGSSGDTFRNGSQFSLYGIR